MVKFNSAARNQSSISSKFNQPLLTLFLVLVLALIPIMYYLTKTQVLSQANKELSSPFWPSPIMDLLQRVGPRQGSNIPDCEDLLEEARKIYCEPGVQALESFYRGLFRRTGIVIPSSEN